MECLLASIILSCLPHLLPLLEGRGHAVVCPTEKLTTIKHLLKVSQVSVDEDYGCSGSGSLLMRWRNQDFTEQKKSSPAHSVLCHMSLSVTSCNGQFQSEDVTEYKQDEITAFYDPVVEVTSHHSVLLLFISKC